MRKALLAFSLFLGSIPAISQTQTISGIVWESANGKKQPLVGVNVYWMGTTSGVVTDAEGRYDIDRVDQRDTLIFSYVGYQSDTIAVREQTPLDVTLSGEKTLQEVVVSGSSTQIDRLSPIQTEVLTARTLAKAACCNLSESFETNASVSVSYADAVTGARQIQMLGLSGNYIQTNVENIPTIRGLSTTFGLNYIPGTWVSSIDIGKGVGSVVNGYEGMLGQINVELQKPDARERVYVNAYANSFGRVEANLNLSKPLTEKWSVGFLGHGSALQNQLDQNNDGFMDLPLYNQYNGVVRAKYASERFMTQFGIKALTEDREGGQLKRETSSAGPRYTFTNATKRIEFFSKTATLYPEKPYKGLGLVLNALYHDQNSQFGFIPYTGRQQSLYGNLIYQSIIDNTNHSIKTGISYLLDDYHERYRDTTLTRTESVPGIFGEYTYKYLEKLTAVVGARLDFHNLFGTQFNPRVHLKYDLNTSMSLRASAGRGFRTPNALAENYGYLVSSRAVFFADRLKPEISWNYGLSLTNDFSLFGQKATFIVDYYRTDFQNQLIVDNDHPRELYFYNLNGARSYSNSFQAELNYHPIKRMEVKLAYRLFDVKQSMGMPFGENVLLPRMMISRDRLLFNAGYALPYDKWKFDFTVQWNGPRRIPYLREGYEHESYQNMPTDLSPSFYNINAQVTKTFRTWDAYLGGENLGGFRQTAPIVGAENPFGRDFDAAGRAWGPITGRMIYVGFRYKLKR
ncbi:TonB-dependent receptor plug domain-containing protein [Tellurirhabdus bombi]|uniref:TonB-dependent receptor plug domain-containing protein n=1 Tax=Tellurirhabdus bombi TaxID=2907205 RepID=UPI00387F946B